MRSLEEKASALDAADTIRFGYAPLYLSFGDIAATVGHLRKVPDDRLWDVDAYKIRAAVT